MKFPGSTDFILSQVSFVISLTALREPAMLKILSDQCGFRFETKSSIENDSDVTTAGGAVAMNGPSKYNS
ncbi:MAG: hypothetical protein KAI84_18025, partial [Gammaproteobacteria bacterium]|nr:hypothetical protein [Gammaproteobacteria bacterium]